MASSPEPRTKIVIDQDIGAAAPSPLFNCMPSPRIVNPAILNRGIGAEAPDRRHVLAPDIVNYPVSAFGLERMIRRGWQASRTNPHKILERRAAAALAQNRSPPPLVVMISLYHGPAP